MRVGAALLLVSVLVRDRAEAQLFESLNAFADRLDSGDPAVPATGFYEGPKGIAAADIDGDGDPDLVASNLDGTVTVYKRSMTAQDFSPPVHLPTFLPTLRGIILEDLTSDGRPEILAAAPLAAPLLGQLVIFPNDGAGDFPPPARYLNAWEGARNLASGDFDGDGRPEVILAGPRLGLRRYRSGGANLFTPAEDVTVLDVLPEDSFRFPKPVYSLKAFRPPAAPRDDLVATHAFADGLWVLRLGSRGALEVQGGDPNVPGSPSLPGIAGVYSLDVGRVASPAANMGRPPDLVTAHRNLGTVEVRRGNGSPVRFEAGASQVLQVPGGPRAVRLADIDRDGWNDLVVAVRNFDRVLTYRNDGSGTLVPGTEMPVGRSPRELAVADFNGDSWPDAAVANRVSSDITVLMAFPAQSGFTGTDQIYLTDGEVVGLAVLDLNGDARGDVLQLHRASAEVSVRLAGLDGHLQPPTYYPVGSAPSELVLADVVADPQGLPDVVTVNLGANGLEQGSLSVLARDGATGRLLPEVRSELPPNLPGRLFALEIEDFDGDRVPDAAAGFLDCRLALFKGSGDGRFAFKNVHYFIYEARAMAAGDFDQDGDQDLAAAAFTGDLAAVENPGDLVNAPSLPRTAYPSPSPDKFKTVDLEAVDLNEDGDPDLVLASGKGGMVYHGTPGMGFELHLEELPRTDFPASSVASGDFDGDGDTDLAVSCQVFSCVTVLTRSEGGDYLPAVSVDVPAGKLLATGDLDGDRFADLVGSGEVLWTALSSRRAQPGPPPVREGGRATLTEVVINEVFAWNTGFPLVEAEGRRWDWIELYNGTGAPVSLAGWTLTLQVPGKPDWVHLFAEDPGGSLEVPAGAHKVVIFEDAGVAPPPAVIVGKKLPKDGGKLVLVKPNGLKADEVAYARQLENVAQARFRDGHMAFIANPYPTPGQPNADNGRVEPTRPEVNELGFSDLLPGIPLRFSAGVEDDLGIVSVSLVHKRLDVPDVPHRVILYDDGLHEDGMSQDGFFTGTIDPGFPAGAQVNYYLEVIDLSGNVVTAPENAGPSADEGIGVAYSFTVGVTGLGLELSELVALNKSGLLDEAGELEDWVEVRNCTSGPISMDEVFLGESFPATENWYAFPPGLVLQSGQAIVVFCDGEVAEGPLHTRFRLAREGGRLVLVGTGIAGGHVLLDDVTYDFQAEDTALAKTACGGTWVAREPTPEAVPVHTVGDVDENGRLTLTDALWILQHLFRGRPLPCLRVADANADGTVDVSDAVRLLLHLFHGVRLGASSAISCG